MSKYRLIAYLVSALFAAIGDYPRGSRHDGRGGFRRTLSDGCRRATFIGYSVFGAGKPNALGTFVGAVLIGILQNGLIMLSVPYFAMDIVKGSVLALALALTYYKKRH